MNIMSNTGEMPNSTVGNLSDEQIKKARAELNENPETRQNDIEIFRKMVQSERDLLSPVDDAFLLSFLRARKFNCERALKLLKGHYKFRLKYEDLHKIYYPSHFKHTFEDNSKLMCLPDLDLDGCKIIVVKFGEWDPEICSCDDLVSAFCLCLEVASLEESVQINGIKVIVDVANFGFYQLRRVNLSTIRRGANVIQDIYPVRIKGVYFMRNPVAFQILFSILKIFLSEKMKKCFVFLGEDVESLHTCISPDILPEDFGGSKPAMDNSEFYKSILDLDEYFKDKMKFGYQNHKNDK